MKLISTFFILAALLLISAQTFAVSSSPDQETLSVQKQHEDAPLPEQTSKEMKETEQKISDVEKEGTEEEDEEEIVKIADPIYPWNKAMYHFNDKFYFWLLKPVSKGYSSVVPEDIRLAVSNFFSNLTMPVRFVSNLLQLKIKNAGNELVRFAYNSTAGVGGLADVARKDLDIKRRDEDIGQALGSYGIDHGFYIVWPLLGPSSVRDTAGKIGDIFLDPVSYVNPTEAAAGIVAYDRVNETSFHIGDYEDWKKSVVNPYVSMRNAYIQHRKKEVEE